MAKKTSIEDVIKKLKDFFCAENKKDRRYSQVWLSEVDFGGLYYSGDVVVHVKAARKLASCFEEMRYIFSALFDSLTKGERSFIWRVEVYNSSERIYCQSDELLVYSLEDACS